MPKLVESKKSSKLNENTSLNLKLEKVKTKQPTFDETELNFT